MTPAKIGLVSSGITLLADQASKLWLLYGYELPMREPVSLGPFVNLIVVWNRGISYGLFQQHGDVGRWALIALSIAAALYLAAWIRRTHDHMLALSLGLIAGGAVGNATDRVALGAVFDFLQIHAGDLSWYVFNVADAAIVAGVAGLIYDSLRPGRDTAKHA